MTYHTATATHRLATHGDVMAALAHGQAEALRLGELVTVMRSDGAMLAVCTTTENQAAAYRLRSRGQRANNTLLGTPEAMPPARRDMDAAVHYDCEHRRDQSLWERTDNAWSHYRCSKCGALGYRRMQSRGAGGVTGPVWTRCCQVKYCPNAAVTVGYPGPRAQTLLRLCELHGERGKAADAAE